MEIKLFELLKWVNSQNTSAKSLSIKTVNYLTAIFEESEMHEAKTSLRGNLFYFIYEHIPFRIMQSFIKNQYRSFTAQDLIYCLKQ